MAAYDLFLSYRTRHAPRVEPLIAALAEQGVRVWRDVDGVRSGDSITSTLREALAESRALAVYASDDYANSSICAWELASAWIAAERLGQVRERVLLLRAPELGELRRDRLGPLLDHRAFDIPDEDPAAVAQAIAEHLARCDRSALGETLDLGSAPR